MESSAGVVSSDLTPDRVEWTEMEPIPDGPREIVVIYQVEDEEGVQEIIMTYAQQKCFPVLKNGHEKDWKNVIGRVTL